MSFLTFSFFAFFAVTLLLYYFLPHRLQNPVLLAASYVFYMFSLPSAGILLALATILAYLCGLGAEKGKAPRLCLAITMVYCLGILFVFKYLNFIMGSVFRSTVVLNLILPIGISFYSFSIISYVFDVYRGRQPAEKDFLRFALFAAYFPSILSGPINRAGDLLPQLKATRIFSEDGFKAGLMRFSIGAAKKLTVSAYLAGIVDTVYTARYDYGSGFWLLTVIFYSIQIYVDFCAYCDMALGISAMLGIHLPENFRAPYFSKTVKEFWKKWHISLTSWFRDYLYFPLGGSRKGKVRTWINILIVFAVSGIWHGAGLPFLVWGLLNGIYQVVGSWTSPARARLHRTLHISENSRLLAVWQGLCTFGLITAAWIFFRSASIEEAIFIIKRILLIFRDGFGAMPEMFDLRKFFTLLPLMIAVFVGDAFTIRGKRLSLEKTDFAYWLTFAFIWLITLIFGTYGPGYNAMDFVYFKF